MKCADFRGVVITKAIMLKDCFYEDYKVGIKREDDYSGGVEPYIPPHVLLSAIDKIQEDSKVDWRYPIKDGMFEIKIEEIHQDF